MVRARREDHVSRDFQICTQKVQAPQGVAWNAVPMRKHADHMHLQTLWKFLDRLRRFHFPHTAS